MNAREMPYSAISARAGRSRRPCRRCRDRGGGARRRCPLPRAAVAEARLSSARRARAPGALRIHESESRYGPAHARRPHVRRHVSLARAPARGAARRARPVPLRREGRASGTSSSARWRRRGSPSSASSSCTRLTSSGSTSCRASGKSYCRDHARSFSSARSRRSASRAPSCPRRSRSGLPTAAAEGCRAGGRPRALRRPPPREDRARARRHAPRAARRRGGDGHVPRAPAHARSETAGSPSKR